MRLPARTFIGLLLWLVLLLADHAHGIAQTAIPPDPTAWVTDTAHFLSPQAASSLNDRLSAYQRQTGHQLIVYISPTTGGVPIEDWSVKAFAKWKIGRKGLDDGLVLFIFPRDRTLRIEVGYGLESKVPDAAANRVLRETIEPLLRAGNADAAVTTGMDRIIALIGEQASGSGGPVMLPLGELVAIAVIVLVLLVIAARNPWFAMFLVRSILSSRGGNGSSNRTFFGGGGRSGGGGASGRW